ncbi:glycine oxidase ThiO [Thiohalocapsa marina]|uniref:Glycine oxidase ThiO n=1 Tax=Thiohalocapsa marina TaxID=424902 RepID=A0A5M8FV75_9GAMM|nr:glycine oxidase ThiO [Thiohalocapsa marina]KAA6187710.1 glycine oxidase ThiO [Thiohalocapsa marina]
MSEILIIGGGVIGLMTARELAQAGERVTLVEMGGTGRESSWAGGGILSPLYPWRYADAVTALARWSQAVYAELCQTLLAQTGVDAEYLRSGLLIVDPDDTESALAWAARHQAAMSTLDAAGIAATEPELRTNAAEAMWMPEIAQVRNPRLTKALRAAVEGRIRLREHEKVIEFRVEQGRIDGVRTTGGDLAAERVVVCTGAWTAQLLEKLEQAPDIRPVRGQMLLFAARPGRIRHVALFRDHYVIPRRDGRVLFGSTLEDAGFEKQTTAAAKEALYQMAVEAFPLLRRAPVEDHWAGLRPASPSGIPYIGQVPGVEGLFVNAGHFRNGLVTGPASARLLTDLVLGREPILPPAPYGLTARRDP